MKCTMDQHDFVGEAGHDWVLVAPRAWTPESGSVVDKLLWACPCDEFKWTSYAEWETRQNSERATAKLEADAQVAAMGGFRELGTLSPDQEPT